MPFIFDKPVEEAVEWTFHKGFEMFGGKDAVGQSKSEVLESMKKQTDGKVKEKEL